MPCAQGFHEDQERTMELKKGSSFALAILTAIAMMAGSVTQAVALPPATSSNVMQTDVRQYRDDGKADVSMESKSAVYGADDYSGYRNLASGSTAVMSVEPYNNPPHLASHAVDGDIATLAQGDSGQPFDLTVRFADDKPVSFDTVTVQGTDNPVYQFRLSYQQSPDSPWKSLVERKTTEEERGNPMSITVPLGQAVTGTAVKFEMLDAKTWVCITELAIYNTSKLMPVEADVPSGTVVKGKRVALSSPQSGTVIHYTVDGSTPTVQSAIYEKPIELASDVTVQAIAVQEGKTDSDISSWHYHVINVDIQPNTTYYVDSTASQDGDGTRTSPFNSLDTVNAVNFLPGDKVLFRKGTEYHGRLLIGDGTQALSTTGAGKSVPGMDSGEPGNPVVFSSYGDGDRMPKIIASEDHIAGREAVLITDAHDVTVENLDISNKDANQSDYAKYIRRGVAIMNHNNGKLSNITVRDNYIHDVTGQPDDGGNHGGAAGVIMEVYSFTRLVVRNGEWARDAKSVVPDESMKHPSWFDNTQILNNRIENVDRSGINAASDYKCREAVDWNYDDGCDATQRKYAPWTPSTNTLIEGNLLDGIGGDGIVVQEAQGAVVQNNKVFHASRSYNPGSTAAVWVWNADDTLFQHNEVAYTSKRDGNNDGTAWDFDYGTRNTVYQYNYSHDNAGGALLTCACGGRMSQAVGAVFRYNVSVNDGVNTQGCEGSKDSHRLTFLAGVKDMSFYNNTVVAPKIDGKYQLAVPSGSANSAFFANNLIVVPSPLADQTGLSQDSSTSTLRWGNNVFVGVEKDGSRWPIVSGDTNTYVPLSVYRAATGLDLEGVAKGDFSTLKIASQYTSSKGRAMAPENVTDYDGNEVPSWSTPDVGAFQTTKVKRDSGVVGDMAHGSKRVVDVPGNAVIAVSSYPDREASLSVGINNGRGFEQTISGAAQGRVTYVRTASDSSQLVLSCSGSGACADVRLRTVEDALWDGSFESSNWSASSLSPWTYGTKDNVRNYDNGYRARDELRSALSDRDKVAVSGDYAAKLGKKDASDTIDTQAVTLNQRAILVRPGQSYTLSFWAILGQEQDAATSRGGERAITASIRYRQGNDGTVADNGGLFDQYTRLIASATCSAGAAERYRTYCSVEFTVPQDADPSGAVWVSISQPDLQLADDNATYIDNVIMAKTVYPAQTSQLSLALQSAAQLRQDRYTPDSWAVYDAAYRSASAVYFDALSTQREVDSALATLRSGIEGLRLVGDESYGGNDSGGEGGLNGGGLRSDGVDSDNTSAGSRVRLARGGSSIMAVMCCSVVLMSAGLVLSRRAKRPVL